MLFSLSSSSSSSSSHFASYTIFCWAFRSKGIDCLGAAQNALHCCYQKICINMTNKGFIIFHLLRKVNAFERINQRHPTDHTHTQNVQLKWVCIFFTENVNCFTVERHPEKVSVRMNNGNESDRDNSSSITKYEEIKVGISANENEVPKCKLLSLRTFTRACNHWLICLQGPPHHSCASPMSQRYSIHTAKSEREKIKYHTYQSVLNTLSLLISFVPCGVARIFLLQCKWIVTLWLQLQCHYFYRFRSGCARVR